MLKRIPPDKWRHFFVGFAVGAVLQAFFWYLLPARPLTATAAAFALTIAISYGFELFSKISGKGRYDFMDAVATAVGGVLGIGLILLDLYLY